MRQRPRDILDQLIRSERGIALPMTMLITVIAMGLAAIPIVASVNTQRGDSRDQGSNAALAAADAGVNVAISRASQMKAVVTSAKPCVKVNTGGTALEATEKTAASEWCPPVALSSTTTPKSPPGTTVEYWVKPNYVTSGTSTMTVVAKASMTVNGKPVVRRLAVEAQSTAAPSSTTKLGSEGLVGEEWINYDGGGNTTYGSVGTNGKFTFSGGNGNKICSGNLRYGPEYEAPGVNAPIGKDTLVPVAERPYRENQQNGLCYPPSPANAKVYPEKVTYPAPEAPSDISTNNSNGRFFSQDGRDLPSWYLQNPTNAWNPTTRTLSIDSGLTLTLGGTAPYFLCRLRVDGGATLRTEATGQPVRIFFDKPENCPGIQTRTLLGNGQTAMEQMKIEGGANVTNNGYYPGFYFLGSSSQRTAAVVNIQNFNGLIYGPLTDFESQNGGLKLSGAIVARTLWLHGGARIESTFKGSEYEIPVKGSSGTPTSYARTKYVECSATAPEEGKPASGC